MEIFKNIEESVVLIGDSLKTIKSYLIDPLLLLKDIVIIGMPTFHFLALVICGTAILMAIMGNRKGLKWLPSTLVIYLILKVLVEVL